MNWYLKELESRQTEGTLQILDRVHLPQQVALPHSGARPSLCITPDGEIRCYSVVDGGNEQGYLEGIDCGLNWKEHYAKEGVGAGTYDPASRRWLRLCSDEDGTWCAYSSNGPDSTDIVRVKVSERPYAVDMLPRIASDGSVYAAGYAETANGYETAFFRSSDSGDHWECAVVEPIAPFSAVYPDKVARPNVNGAYPTVLEKKDGSMWMLVATSDDYLWEYTSADGGRVWSAARRTTLHATYTGACLTRLSDGRILLIWNNTSPMPTRVGVDTTLTNRDVCHCAISEDEGLSWIGQREVFLPACRAYADYSVRGGDGVTDFEVLEVPRGRILLHFGHTLDTERIVLFALDYLQDEGRTEDFLDGMAYFSTQSYLKNGNGACLNRIPGAIPVQDPDTVLNEKTKREVLHVYRYHDARLLSETMGAVQNFPAWEMGEITVEVRISGAPLRVSLADHWINPSDPCAEEKSVFSFTFDYLDAGRIFDYLDDSGRETNLWSTYKIVYSLKHRKAVVVWSDMPEEDQFEDRFLHKCIFSIRQNHRVEAPNGLSYIHFQTTAQDADDKGAHIGRIEYRRIDEFPYTDLS